MTRKNPRAEHKSTAFLEISGIKFINTYAPLRQGENGKFFFIADKLYHTLFGLSIAF